MKFTYPFATVTVCVTSLVLLSSAVDSSAQLLAGYYKLQVAFGHYNRSDSGVGVYDGVQLVTENAFIEFDDSALNNGQDESYLVIFGDGQVTGHWSQQLDFAASFSSSFGVEAYSGSVHPKVRLDVDVTGTVVSQTANSVTLQLTALIDCDYDKGFSFGSFEGASASWSAADISLPMTVTATRNPDGSLVFPVPTATEILPLLAAASPALPSLDGEHIRNFALSGVSIQSSTTRWASARGLVGRRFSISRLPQTALSQCFPNTICSMLPRPMGLWHRGLWVARARSLRLFATGLKR